MIKARFDPFISVDFDHVTQMIFIGPTGCCQLEHLVVVMTEIWNIEISSLSFMLSGTGGVQLCVFERKRLPGPPWPPPGPGQPASSSRGVTTISSRCALAPLQPQKWFWRYVSHQWSKESSSESSQNFLPLHRSIRAADRTFWNQSGEVWKPKLTSVVPMQTLHQTATEED